jgi:hypothetical protein
VRFADGAAAAAAKAHNKHFWGGADSAPMVVEAVNLDKKRSMISADGELPHNSSGSGFASAASALAASGACASGGLAALRAGSLQQQQQHAAACTASHPQLYCGNSSGGHAAAAAVAYEAQQQQQQAQQQAALSNGASGSLTYLACGFSVVPAAPEVFASVGDSQAGWAGAVGAGQQLQPASMLACGSSGAGLLGDLSVLAAGGACEAYGPGLLSDQLPSMFANNSNIYSGYIHSCPRTEEATAARRAWRSATQQQPLGP